VTALAVLAAAAKTAPTGSDAPGALAFLVIFGMAVILFFLFRSMSKHLRKVTQAGQQQATASKPGDAADPPPYSTGDPGAAGPPPYSTGSPGDPGGGS
jgi:hypothetical protein